MIELRQKYGFVVIACAALAACGGNSSQPIAPIIASASPASPTPKAVSTTPPPTEVPTIAPSSTPTSVPTATPTSVPSATPTALPTATPTTAPSPVAQNSASCDTDAYNGISCYTELVQGSNDFRGLANIQNSNHTGLAANYASSFYLTNPGTFMVAGAVFAASQSVMTVTPAMLTGSPINLQFFLSEAMVPTTAPVVAGTSFTCTAYDNNTLLGSATSTTLATNNAAPRDFQADCLLSNVQHNATPGTAAIDAPISAVNSGDSYTFILSY